ncbi:hypothetical protein [Corynebacterium pelargi]|uniref:Uncharacterized protein n=1 Tax=Corynebacterium pelargi TaxID=1471400 RepID=A0A410W875_9CORY|nr:hypothetical protein [Corynebacterium pelargi]QAU52149.1 hypothetical protein CPELA_04350 [Corynebacterium pelargi]GGG69800.1 hypothetical protein GCM10007338_03240 [Corynebacterium pelargi]
MDKRKIEQRAWEKDYAKAATKFEDWKLTFPPSILKPAPEDLNKGNDSFKSISKAPCWWFGIAGIQYFQDVVFEQVTFTKNGTETRILVSLIPEPGNPHDPSAVAVYIGDSKIGFLNSRISRLYHTKLKFIQHHFGVNVETLAEISRYRSYVSCENSSCGAYSGENFEGLRNLVSKNQLDRDKLEPDCCLNEWDGGWDPLFDMPTTKYFVNGHICLPTLSRLDRLFPNAVVNATLYPIWLALEPETRDWMLQSCYEWPDEVAEEFLQRSELAPDFPFWERTEELWDHSLSLFLDNARLKRNAAFARARKARARKIVKLRDSGKSFREIGTLVNVSPGYASRIYRDTKDDQRTNRN